MNVCTDINQRVSGGPLCFWKTLNPEREKNTNRAHSELSLLLHNNKTVLFIVFIEFMPHHKVFYKTETWMVCCHYIVNSGLGYE